MRLVMLMVSAALAAVLSSCGGSGSTDSGLGMPPKVPKVTEFPKVRGRTMGQLAATLQAGPVLAPSASLLELGNAHVGFRLFDRTRKAYTHALGALSPPR